MSELTAPVIIFVAATAFLCEYVDSTLGMGYGTTLCPVLLLMGFKPTEIVPAILLSELVTGFLAAGFHHREGNAQLKPQACCSFHADKLLTEPAGLHLLRISVPRHLKVALLLGGCGVVGTTVAVFTALSIPALWLRLYIGVLVLAMGIVVVTCRNTQTGFSWKRMGVLGVLASFNKGISGGGYGPVVTAGQILSGIESKSAVAITSLAEALTCLAGLSIYLLACSNVVIWKLGLLLVMGATASAPLTARTVRLIHVQRLKVAIGVLTIALGLLTLTRTLR